MTRPILMLLILGLALVVTTVSQPSGDVVDASQTSRSSPLPYGETGAVGDFEVEVVGVDFDASDAPSLRRVAWSRTPTDALRVVRVTLNVTVTATESDSDSYSLSSDVLNTLVVGRDSNQDIDEESGCAFVETDSFTGRAMVPSLYAGGSATVDWCFLVPTPDIQTLVMYASMGGERIWLALDEDSLSTPVGTPKPE